MTSEQPDPSRPRAGRSLSGRLTRRTLLAVGLPLVVCIGFSALLGSWLTGRVAEEIDEARRELAETTVGEVKAGQSDLVVARIDDLLDRLVESVAVSSRSPELVEALGTTYPRAADLAGTPPDQAESALDGVLDTSGATSALLADRAGATPGILQMLATDGNGFAVGATEPVADSVSAGEAWWTEAWTTGSSVGPVGRDADGVNSFIIAFRVDDPVAGQPVGVVRATIDASAVQAVADTVADPDRGLDVAVVADDGTLVADTASGHDPARIGVVGAFLDGRDSAFEQVLSSQAETGFLAVGDTVTGYSRLAPTRPVPVTGAEVANPRWAVVVDQPSSQALVAGEALDRLDEDTARLARLLPLALAALAVPALVLAAVLARAAARRITGPLDQLARAAYRLAEHDLPSLLQPGSSGRPRATSGPVKIDADNELSDLAVAFDSLRTSAIGLAADQATDRNREVATVLVNLGRRNQQLIGRQLRFIDTLERAESNPDTLRNLFILDQMATRMRRNAESLLVLAGEESPRRGAQPRPVDEVIRAASSEVEEFARVSIRSMEQALVDPRVISDLTHLLAELIENATLFSPPDAPVEVTGAHGADGSYAISIVDRGLGLPADRLEEANSRIADAALPGTPASSFMGLFVVGRLAARHNIAARLIDSADSGVTAVVTLPPSCLVTIQEPAADVRGSRIHVSGPLTGPYQRPSAPPPVRRPVRPPVQPRPTPAAVARPAGEADTGVQSGTTPAPEDETEGLPIPPFRSRQPKRGTVAHLDAAGADQPVEEGLQVPGRLTGAGQEQPGSTEGDQQGVAAAGSGEHTPATESAQARAEKVRDRLNRFASGVEAAKAERAESTGDSPADQPVREEPAPADEPALEQPAPELPGIERPEPEPPDSGPSAAPDGQDPQAADSLDADSQDGASPDADSRDTDSLDTDSQDGASPGGDVGGDEIEGGSVQLEAGADGNGHSEAGHESNGHSEVSLGDAAVIVDLTPSVSAIGRSSEPGPDKEDS